MCFFVTWKQKDNSDEWGNDLKRQGSEEQEKIMEKKMTKYHNSKKSYCLFLPSIEI